MEQNTQEWLDFRRNKIGASDAPVIMGISPYNTPFKLWEQKVFGKQTEQNSAMARGHALEETARHAFEKKTGIVVMPKVVVHPQREWQMASIDGLSFCGSIFVEIKCPNKEVHQMAERGEIPPHYYAQMQHQMSVLDAQEGYYFSFNGVEGALVRVARESSFINTMLEQEENFLEMMKKKDSPALTDKDYVPQDNSKWLTLAEEWKQLDDYIKSLEAQRDETRKLLIGLADGQSSRGGGIRATKTLCKGTVDYKKIPELKGIDLETYRKPSFEKWTLAACK
jgi:putative phage-type endonuclease